MLMNYLKKIYKNYSIGYILSIIFTVIPFFIISLHNLNTFFIKSVIIFCCFFQILVHLIYFMHLDNQTDKNHWNLFTLFFSVIIIAIIFCGSIWIMFHLNENMIM